VNMFCRMVAECSLSDRHKKIGPHCLAGGIPNPRDHVQCITDFYAFNDFQRVCFAAMRESVFPVCVLLCACPLSISDWNDACNVRCHGILDAIASLLYSPGKAAYLCVRLEVSNCTSV